MHYYSAAVCSRFCISRFHDCPICGADIEGIEADNELQKKVDQFIEGHARVKRLLPKINGSEEDVSQSNVVYADVSLERGTFLVQQAMRVSHQNANFFTLAF
jgi:hypothetical protein